MATSAQPTAPPAFQPTSPGQGLNSPWYSDTPSAPAYSAVYDPATMSLLPDFQKYMDMNSQGFTQLRNEALRKGPSAWAGLAKVKQAQDAANERNKGAQSTANESANALDQLAMHGGFSSGARERLAESGAKNYTNMQQAISQQENSNNAQIGLNDEQQRLQELSQLAPQEQQRTSAWENVKAQDQGNVLKENESRNQYNQNLYNQQMQAWAANRQAQATENSGKK